jgi:MYXO-CTERM domain-containing protein
MKFLDVKGMIRASALVLGLAVITTAPTFAQSNANNNINARTDTTRVVERDDDSDWGWLGLLGLLGLAGLLPKKRRVEVQEFRDTAQNRPASGAETTH